MTLSSDRFQAEMLQPILAQATQLLSAGRTADAIAPLREAGRLSPANAHIQHDLGLACLEVGLLAEAMGALRQAIALNPRYAEAYFRLGVALEKLGDSGSAVAAYDRATQLSPALTEAWFRAGSLVFTMGHRDEAIGCFRRAASSSPKTRFGRLGAARALLAQDRDAEAERKLRETIAADPLDALAHDLLGSLLAEAGRFDEARECFEGAVKIAPLMAGSYYDLVRCRPVTPADTGLIQTMEQALLTPGLEVAHQMRVHLALGKAADDLGDYERAMRHFDAADRLRQGVTSFNSAAFDAEVTRLMERCRQECMALAPALGIADATPIFIIGMPRSGTTLVEQIISSHPKVRAGGELNFWNERGAAWHQAGSAGLSQDYLRRAAGDYLKVLRAIGPKAGRVTDKMPFNFLWAGLIHLAFPRATIIHCRRAPIDAALSIHQTLFHPSLAFPTGGPKLVDYFRSYLRLCAHWRAVLPAERYLEVDYEQLTREPDAGIRRLIEACGLPWDPACLAPERNPRSVKTPSKWQTRQPIYRHSVERWRRYEPWLGPLRALLDAP